MIVSASTKAERPNRREPIRDGGREFGACAGAGRMVRTRNRRSR